MRKKILLFTLILALFGVSGCMLWGGNKENPTIARFDGQTITKKEVDKKFETLPNELKRVVTKRKKEFVEDLVNERFLLKEAERKNVANQPEVQDLLKTAREKILVARLLELEVDKKIALGPDDAANYYEDHKEQFMTPLMLRASQILVQSEEKAKEIKAQLDQGGDFEELARKNSLDYTAARGGDIGFFQKSQLIPEFEDKAFSMKKGETSDVFKTQFGYHIIKLTDRAEPSLRDFKAMKPLIERQLLNEKRSDRFKEYIGKIKGNAKIEIDDKKLELIGKNSKDDDIQVIGVSP